MFLIFLGPIIGVFIAIIASVVAVVSSLGAVLSANPEDEAE